MTGKLGGAGAAADPLRNPRRSGRRAGLRADPLRHVARRPTGPGAVHGRAGGRTCEVCGDTIRSVTYSGYTVAYCPTCQTGGKVLADNTTSKFLR
ncbi:MAG: hypothetical protein V9E89_18650 [Ilumatobacteraceae bacterium]